MLLGAPRARMCQAARLRPPQRGRGASAAAAAEAAQPKQPRRVVLVRHGESMGNVDESAYVRTADWRIPLSARGQAQASEAGRALAELLEGQVVAAYVSPYRRTKQTWAIIAERLVAGGVRILGTREDPRLVEQQFGNFQNVEEVRRAKEERREFGRFFYRFPSGEAGLDVYSRASAFLGTLGRDTEQVAQMGQPLNDLNMVVVTHGLTLRLLLMRYFQLSVDEFEATHNPPNAALVVMDRRTDPVTGRGYFQLDAASQRMLNLKREVSTQYPVWDRVGVPAT